MPSRRIDHGVLGALAALFMVAMAAPAAADPESTTEAPSQLAAAERTHAAVSAREAEIRAHLADRLRALHKRHRATARRLWVDPSSRRAWLRARAAAARVVRRDVAELAILREELTAAEDARERARAEAAAASATPLAPAVPARRSLARPIARGRVTVAFGAARDGRDAPTLASRGVDLACAPGDPVLAAADGVVRWSGPLAGAGAAVIDHVVEGVRFTSLLAGLDPGALPVPGAHLGRAEPFARAAGTRVHLEVRVPVGAVAEPVDPAPLLD